MEFEVGFHRRHRCCGCRDTCCFRIILLLLQLDLRDFLSVLGTHHVLDLSKLVLHIGDHGVSAKEVFGNEFFDFLHEFHAEFLGERAFNWKQFLKIRVIAIPK